jgi:hypothetical protein
MPHPLGRHIYSRIGSEFTKNLRGVHTMKASNLKLSLTTILFTAILLPGLALAKGSVTATAYVKASAPADCHFVETSNTQNSCAHTACNTAVKNAIKSLQNAQPNGACKAEVTSRGCKYKNCS